MKKGEKAQASILIPLIGKVDDDDDGEDNQRTRIYGFKGAAVFDITQTEGEPVDEFSHPHEQLIADLPLIDVARKWGLAVDTYSGQGHKYQGLYSKTKNAILLGVENENTWLHELIHAADDRRGNLKEHGQHWRSETVAQLGATVLAKMIGREDIADEGKTYRYIKQYAAGANKSVESACLEVINRTATAIELILTETETSTLGD